MRVSGRIVSSARGGINRISRAASSMSGRIGVSGIDDAFAAVGSMTRRGRAEMELGMGGRFADIRRQNLIGYGRRATGYAGIGASAVIAASSNRSTGAYTPGPRPAMSAPPSMGRFA
jgi:hypothetical protein